MRIPEVEDLRQAIATGAAVPAVLITGGDDAVREGVVAVLSDALKAGGEAVSVVRLDAGPARTDAWQKLGDVAGAVPLFGEAWVVVVDGCDGAKLPDELKRALASPPPHARLVLCAGRKAAGLGKAVEAAGGRVITPAELRDWQVGTVVEQAARDAGVSLDRAAVAALVDMAGADRASIEAAIRGVAAYKGRGARVTEEDLRGLVQRTRQPMPWDLTDAINGRDLKTALKVAGREMADGGPGTQVALFHRIVRQARLLLQTVDLVEARVPDDEAAERLKVKGFPWKKLREAAGRWRRAELAAFLREAPAMEQLAKRAHGSPEAVVADMLSRLIGAGGGPSARRR